MLGNFAANTRYNWMIGGAMKQAFYHVCLFLYYKSILKKIKIVFYFFIFN